METSKKLDTVFKTMVIRMLTDLRGRIDDVSENLKRQ